MAIGKSLNKYKQGIAPLQVLCLNCLREQHPVINIIRSTEREKKFAILMAESSPSWDDLMERLKWTVFQRQETF